MWTRLFSFALLAGIIWVAIEVYSKGTAGAFGGAISFIGPGAGQPAREPSPLVRIQGAASGARDRQLHRIEGQLGDDASVGLQAREAAPIED